MAVIGMRVYPGTPLAQRARAERRIDDATDLLPPTYYLAPGLSEESILTQVRGFAASSGNWIAGEPSQVYAQLAERLRRRGVRGPLWNHLAVLQRLFPASRVRGD